MKIPAVDEGVLLLAADGALDDATPGACALFGCDDVDALRRRWTELGAGVRDTLARPGAAPGTDANRFDLDLPLHDGTHRLRIDVSPQSADAARRIAIVRDRDQLGRAEADLRAATMLRTWSRLAAAIAHDLKGPLAAVLLHLELLRGTLADGERDDPPPREKALRYVGVMKDELARLNTSLTSLFTNTAFKPDTLETFDLRDVLRDLEFWVRPQARRQTVTLDLTIGERPVLVTGYREALKHAVLNVAVNALEAMNDGGTLEITLANDDTGATISLRDTGAGIPAAALPAVYEPRVTTKPNARGMGLYVARSVLAEHGGSLRAESTSHGTRCDIRVPVTPAV